jgi:NAD(P)-dependent dehydrogenase (short-subunit alcohol dehydrogenase family)
MGAKMESRMSEVVLITGCSTGIGHDLAQRLARSGYTVVATARKAETLADLDVALKLALDVTQPESIRQAVECVLQRFGRIDVLVNNAGYAVRGAVEEVPAEQAQQMFDANVFGVMRMIQAVVPHMRRQKTGRIISSVVGKLVTPANGTYSASKFALEALSSALRLELAPFGIQVVLVEPGSIKTQFHSTVEANAQEIFSNSSSPYQPLYQQYQKVTADMRRQEPGPEAVSWVVQQAMQTSRPKARYLAGFPFSGRLVLHLGDLVWDRVVRQMFKIQAAFEPR